LRDLCLSASNLLSYYPYGKEAIAQKRCVPKELCVQKRGEEDSDVLPFLLMLPLLLSVILLSLRAVATPAAGTVAGIGLIAAGGALVLIGLCEFNPLLTLGAGIMVYLCRAMVRSAWKLASLSRPVPQGVDLERLWRSPLPLRARPRLAGVLLAAILAIWGPRAR
jgi:hypothetical protein